MEIKPFLVEEWMNQYEVGARYNIAETCVDSVSLDELFQLTGEDKEAFLSSLCARRLTYGDIFGQPAFLEGICQLYRDLRPEQVIPTHGAAGANHHLFCSLVEPGDKVISVLPTYQQLYSIPDSLGAQVELLPLSPDNGFLPDLARLEELARGGVKLICLNNANNPTGTFLDRAFMEQVVDVARGVGAYVLVDEVYLPLVGTEDFASVVDLYDKGVATNSLSKTYSVPGARIGWTASSPAVADLLRPYRDYTMICCGVVNDALAVHVLENRDAVLERNRPLVLGNLAATQAWIDAEPRVSWVAPQGVSTSFIKLDIPEDDEAFCLRLLEDEGVLLVPGSRFDMPGHARLGYCAPEPVLRAGLAGLGRALRRFD